jgi:hypothetical protein
VTGNQSEILQTNQFNSVSNQSILQHDLWERKAVQERFYKTKQFFEKIYSTTKGKYIVCS